MECIAYRRGYKYQLQEDYEIETILRPSEAVGNDWLLLDADGRLLIRKGYAWDGPSGPTFDTPDFMRGSLVHDALYQLIREGLLSEDYLAGADELLRAVCLEDGMSRLRAWWVYRAVRRFGNTALDPQMGKRTEYAPEGCHGT